MWNLACEGVDVCRCILTNNEDYIGLTSSRKRVFEGQGSFKNQLCIQ